MLGKKINIMLFYPSFKESFNHDQCDPLDAQLIKSTRAEIKTAIDILEISDDFFKYFLDGENKKMMLTPADCSHSRSPPGALRPAGGPPPPAGASSARPGPSPALPQPGSQ